MPSKYFDLSKEFNPQKYHPDLLMKAAKVTLTADGKPVAFTYADKTVAIQLPAAKRSTGVDVVKVELMGD